MAIEMLASLSEEKIGALVAYAKEVPLVPATSYRRRTGMNKQDNLSVYSVAKVERQPLAERRLFRDNMPEEYVNRALTEYFIEYPPKTGHLDVQTYWTDKPRSMKIVAAALRDKQSIWIDDVLGQVTLTTENASKYYGHGVVLNGKPVAILSVNNVFEYLDKVVLLRKPMKEYVLMRGQVIAFDIDHIHQIKPSAQGQLWAVIGATPY